MSGRAENEIALNNIIAKIGQLPEALQNRVRPFRLVPAYINKITAQRFQKHISPDGIPWEKTKSLKVKKGQSTFIGFDKRSGSKRKDKKIIREVRNVKEKQKINKRRPGRLNALYRPSKTNRKRIATKLRKMFVGKSGNNILVRNNNSLIMGNSWSGAGIFHRGNEKQKVPARPFFALNKADQEHILGLVEKQVHYALKKHFQGKKY